MGTPAATLGQVLDSAMQLSSDEQEMLLDIIRRRLTEERRRQIAEDAQESVQLFHAGQLPPQTADEIIDILDHDLDA